jgi:hypothetical protein
MGGSAPHCADAGVGGAQQMRQGRMRAVQLALAQFAGQTVAAAAITDAWKAVRGRFARLAGQ